MAMTSLQKNEIEGGLFVYSRSSTGLCICLEALRSKRIKERN
jgi:hypothetical protein